MFKTLEEKTEEKVSSEKLQTFKLRMDDKQIVIEHKVTIYFLVNLTRN